MTYVYGSTLRKKAAVEAVKKAAAISPIPRPVFIPEPVFPKDLWEDQEEPMVEAQLPPLRNRTTGTHQQRWDQRVQQLVDFINDNQRLPMSRSEDHEETVLATAFNKWISYDNRGKLPEERREQLMAVHPLVAERLSSPRGKDQWEKSLQNLKQFIDDHGRLPASTDPQRFQSARNWIKQQATLHRQGKLSKERYTRLFWLSPLVQERFNLPDEGRRWRENLAKLESFVDEHQKLPKAGGTEPNAATSHNWLQNQRMRYRRGRMTDEQLAMTRASRPLITQRMLGEAATTSQAA